MTELLHTPEGSRLVQTAKPEGNVDLRESLANEQRRGLIHQVQLPTERITQLHGILFDLDPDLLVPGNAYFAPDGDPRVFLGSVQQVLNRHPLARHAEVRSSGRGLHLVLWLSPAVELTSEADQRRWAAIARALQRTLPVDPDMPGITAVTRPVGSVNGKNGKVVERLKKGEPVEPRAVKEFLERVASAPFREVANILFGRERVSPCPVCKKAGSRLDVLDHFGKCYGGCSKVTLDQLYDLVVDPVEVPSSERRMGEGDVGVAGAVHPTPAYPTSSDVERN